MLTLAVVAAGAILAFRSVYEPDLGWHLAHGREDLAGRLVRTNIFSAAYADYPQPFTSWLWETATYAAWRISGDAAVQALQALIIAAALALVWTACRVRSAIVPALAIAVLGFLVIEPRAIPRPHLVSFAGLAAISLLIERAIAQRSAKPLNWAVPVVILWSNAHVESIFGVALIGMFGLGECIRPAALARRDAVRVLLVSALCAPGVMMTPYGWQIGRYVVENAAMPQFVSIAELRPAYLPVYRAFMAYAAIGALLLLSDPRRLTLWESLVALLFGALGFRYLRLTPLIFFATAPLLAARLTWLTVRGVDARAVLVTALAAAALISRLPLIAYVAELRAGQLFPDVVFSPGAIAFVRETGLGGPMFNSHNLGGWIEWELYPNARVFQDSRMQAYPREHFERILDASQSQASWDRLVSGVDWAMLSLARPNQLSGVGRFPRESWATVYWDEAVEIVVRRTGRLAAIAGDREYVYVTPGVGLGVVAEQMANSSRIAIEAQRQAAENPKGFLGVEILCLTGDERSCAEVDRRAAEDPSLENEARLVKMLRGK